MTVLPLEKEKIKGNSIVYPFCDESSGLLSLRTKPSVEGDGECLILFKVLDFKRVGRDKDAIYIQDIYSNGPVNEGYGSAAMRALIKYAISKNYDSIGGHLSPDDQDHIARLHHFYKKHGFELPEGLYGSISLDLSNASYILSQIDNQLLIEENLFIKNQISFLKSEYKKLEQELGRLVFEKENETNIIKFFRRVFRKNKIK
ncbi:GNAT family N-acetyltransferase [Bacillus sp. FJAT-26377]|nr:GNAT family N-acetyltransferase [Bacillus sp. FJAT-26377]